MTRVLYPIAGGLLLGLLDFGILSANVAPLTLAAAALLGVASGIFGRYFPALGDVRSIHLEVLLAAGAASFALALQAMLAATSWAAWVGVPLAALAAWVTRTRFRAETAEACFVCQTPIRGELVLRCPRCHQVVCGQPDCWNARFLRCRLCHDRGVVVLPTRDPWWQQHLGERVMQGSCFSCYKDAQEADLRACGRCHWPICRRCWDYHNGQCPRCKWVMTGLPDELIAWMPAARRSRGAAPVSAGIDDEPPARAGRRGASPHG